MPNYLAEAFQRLSLLEDEIPASEIDWKERVSKYLEDDVPEEGEEEIIDPEANDESELQDSYVGKVIIECNSCHTRLYKNQEDLGANEDGSAVEIAEDCPVCGQHGTGWAVIGKIEPFDANQEFPEDGEPVEAGGEDDIDFGMEDEPIEGEPEAEVNDDIPMDGEEVPAEEEPEFEDEDEFGEAFKKAFGEANKGENLEEAEDNNADDVCPECGKARPECKCAAQHKAKFERSTLNGGAERELVKNEKIKEGLTEGCECGKKDCDGSCEDQHEHNHHEHHHDHEEEKMDEGILGAIGSKILDVADTIYKDTLGKNESVDEACIEEDNAMMNRLRRKMMGVKAEACNEEMCEHGNENLEVEKDVACDDDISLEDDQKDITPEANSPMHEELHIEATGEDKVDIKKNDDGSVSLEVGGGFEDGFVGDPMDDVGGEMIAPIDQAQADEIAAQTLDDEEAPVDEFSAEEEEVPAEDVLAGDEAPIEGEEEIPGEEGEEDMAALEGDEFDDFQEEEFDYLGEAYLRHVYENVNSFKTTDVKLTDNGLVVEGLIKFESGKEKATKFVFENMQKTKRGKYVFEGLNETFSNSNKAFTLKGDIIDKTFKCESMTVNYTARTLNESNESESVKVYYRVAVK